MCVCVRWWWLVRRGGVRKVHALDDEVRLYDTRSPYTRAQHVLLGRDVVCSMRTEHVRCVVVECQRVVRAVHICMGCCGVVVLAVATTGRWWWWWWCGCVGWLWRLWWRWGSLVSMLSRYAVETGEDMYVVAPIRDWVVCAYCHQQDDRHPQSSCTQYRGCMCQRNDGVLVRGGGGRAGGGGRGGVY